MQDSYQEFQEFLNWGVLNFKPPLIFGEFGRSLIEVEYNCENMMPRSFPKNLRSRERLNLAPAQDPQKLSI